MSMRGMARALVVGVLASVLVFGALAVWSDGPEVVAAMADFSWSVFLAMLLLGLGCFVARSLRWGWLMRGLGYPVGLKDSLYLHIAGQTMSISPGRVGEVLKPWLSREIAGMPMSTGIALVFAERVADLIAVSLLSVGGITLVGSGIWGLLALLGMIGIGTAIASSAWFHRIALGFLSKRQWARKHQESAVEISETVRVTLSWRQLMWSVPVSAFAWGLEGIGLWLCLRELGLAGIGLAPAVSVYAVSTIVGAFTFLPGGIGLTEASMAGLLAALGVSASDASVATLLTRVATLWWAVGLGWIVLVSRPSVFRSLVTAVSAESGDAD